MLEVRCGICQAAAITRREVRSGVIEDPGGHVRNFDTDAMGNPESERAFFFFFFFLPDLRLGWRM